VVYREEEGIHSAIDGITKRAKTLGWERPQPVNMKELKDWLPLLRDGKIDALFWLASSEKLGEFFAAAAPTQVFPAGTGAECVRGPRNL
jgi:hypothetical protein